MNLMRKIGDHRPAVVLAGLVTLSLLSLATGVESTIVHRAVHRVVSLTAYPFLKAKHGAEEALASAAGLVADYAALRAQNETLFKKVIEQQESLAGLNETRRENTRLRRMLQFEQTQPRLNLEPANVIESLQGMLTIDRGTFHGIKRSMSVVTAQGVVGVITEVFDFTSKVATLHHYECKVGAMVMRNRLRAYDGVVHAGGDSGGWCTMYYIDMKEDVRQGDLVVTSPESLFPAGYPIGTISAPPHSVESLWKWAEVTPAVDPYRLDEVFVIRRSIPSAEELAGPTEEAPPAGAVSEAPAPPLPESATIAPPESAAIAENALPLQERYAP